MEKKHANSYRGKEVSDAQFMPALAKIVMAYFAIHTANPAITQLALSAGNVAQVVSAMMASSAQRAASSAGATVARLTGVSPAPRKHMDAEQATSWDAAQMKKSRRDSAMISAHLTIV